MSPEEFDKRRKAKGREVTDAEELLQIACRLAVYEPYATRLYKAIVRYVNCRIDNHEHLSNAKIGT